MATTELKVSVKLHADRVYYHYGPAPPERSRWGSSGAIYANGQLLGMTYTELRGLGDGAHILNLDLKAQTSPGMEPRMSDDEERVHNVWFAVFLYESGVDTMHGCIAVIIRNCVEATARTIREFLPRDLLERMMSDAQTIPESIPRRKANPSRIISSNGSFDVPDENLDAIRRHFLV